jgi:cell division protein FtsW
LTFLNPQRDPLGASYHVRQILIALGSGGIFGLGLGQSRQKHEFLPAVTTDSIFAVIGEELGFVGAALIVFVFLALIWRGIKVANQAPDDFGRLLAVGITAWIGLQALVNLAAMVALVPLTGVPLPFISYGGSSLVLALTGVGILLNISKQRVVKK